MEILQTIWNVLITQNERLTNIIISPLIPIENYIYMINFLLILNHQSTKKQKLIYIISISSLVLFNIFFIPMPYYTFINVLIYPIVVYLVFKMSILKSILSEIIIYILSMLLSTPLILFYTNILNLSSSIVSSVPIYRITYCLAFFSLMIIFYLILKKDNLNIKTFTKLKGKNNKILLSNFIIGVICIAIQLYTEFLFIDYVPYYLVILSTSVLFIYFTISLYSLFRTLKLEITTKNLEEEKLYNQTLTVLYDSIRGFKHDFNNIVQGIGGYVSTNNMEGLKEYYSQVLDDCQKVNNLALLSPDVINNPAIYSLITSKYHKAMEFGIKIDLEIFMDLTNINIKIYELTRVLGILIDNAIEASKDCEEKEIIITFRKDKQKNKQLFIIQNTYSNKDVNIDEIFEKGKTSKTSTDSKSHGLGLWEIRQLIKKNKNLDLYTTKTEKYFKQQFEIYC